MLQVRDASTKALLDLADFFEDLDPKLYNQSFFEVNDTRCICGWANYRAGNNASPSDIDEACIALGIDYSIGMDLFRATGGSKTEQRSWLASLFREESTITPPTTKDAARCLRHLAVTGELPADW